jgi:GT2 family glycosyltransferase
MNSDDIAPEEEFHADEADRRGAAFMLARGVVLAACEWTSERPARGLRPFLNDGPLAGPCAATVLSAGGGGQRVYVAFQWPADGAGDGVTLRAAGAQDGLGPPLPLPAPFDPKRIFAGLGAQAQVRLARFLIELPQTTFPRLAGPHYAALCRLVLRGCGACVVRLNQVVGFGSRYALFAGQVPAALAAPATAAIVGRARVAAVPFVPLLGEPRGKTRSVHVMLDASDAAQQDDLAVLFGRAAIAVAKVEPAHGSRGLLEWLEQESKMAPALRDYVTSCLAQRAPSDKTAAAALTEVGLFKPMARRRVVTPDRPIGAAIEQAIGCGEGMFVSGWIRDPYGVVARLVALGSNGVRRPIDLAALRFARPDVEAKYAKSPHRASDPRIGFAGFVRGRSPLGAQHRFQLELNSGARVELVAPPASPDPAEACNAVLRAIPVDALSPAIIESILAPAAAPLHRAHLARRAPPDSVVLGDLPQRPRASIIVPLYRNLDFLRFQLAAFAVDPALREAELIYVLDSPEQRATVEHLLRGLHGLYGQPLRLVVMSRNFGYAAANNAGAALATGQALILLNSDVIPTAPGWLGRLLAPLERAAAPRVGAVGAKLLFDDGSLQHAGLHFRRDARGRWINDHYFKGMPRDFAPARAARPVPAVTGAAIAVRRTVFAEIGGFTEDYIIGDYEDSDLCLKIRQRGLEILYAPEAELFHFERKSIAAHAGYMRGVACEYNNWLHGQRWNAAIEQLMAAFAAPGAECDAEPSAEAA